MSWLNKVWNLIRGRGYTEDVQEDVQEDVVQEVPPEPRQALEEAENLDIPKVEEERLPEVKEEVRKEIYAQADREESRAKSRELLEAKRRYSKGMRKDEAEKMIESESDSKVKFKPTRELGELRNIYSSLMSDGQVSIRDKNGNVDKELMGILIDNRDKLQHRFAGEVEIITNKGIATLNIDGILAEHMADIYKSVSIGETYASQELRNKLEEASREFEKQYGSIGGGITVPPSNRIVVQDINITISFA